MTAAAILHTRERAIVYARYGRHEEADAFTTANSRAHRELACEGELRRYDEERALIEQDLGQEATALAELVIALDEWLARGGFRPARWFTG